jgi:catechol 2,3-dioxygenase-like lactoylglutathione lyase family enzyme
VIRGMHGMLFSTDAEATRRFFRDTLGFEAVDVGEGWLIFNMPEADMGVHPGDAAGFHLSFYTDDLEATMTDLKAKGVEFTPIQDPGWGLVTTLKAPGGLELELYQPRYTTR